jgi:hypothetical protein
MCCKHKKSKEEEHLADLLAASPLGQESQGKRGARPPNSYKHRLHPLDGGKKLFGS